MLVTVDKIDRSSNTYQLGVKGYINKPLPWAVPFGVVCDSLIPIQ